MTIKRMVKIKNVPIETNGLISEYMARKLFLEKKISGCRLGNSMILIDMNGLEEYLISKSLANIKEEEQDPEIYGRLRKVY